jgi:hypothetical protein
VRPQVAGRGAISCNIETGRPPAAPAPVLLFAFAVMADPVSSVAYAIEAARPGSGTSAASSSQR